MQPYSLSNLRREAQFVNRELAEVLATLYALRMRLASAHSAVGHLAGALLAAEDAQARGETELPGLDTVDPNDLTSWPRNALSTH